MQNRLEDDTQLTAHCFACIACTPASKFTTLMQAWASQGVLRTGGVAGGGGGEEGTAKHTCEQH